jgi:hypothetical protein
VWKLQSSSICILLHSPATSLRSKYSRVVRLHSGRTPFEFR